MTEEEIITTVINEGQDLLENTELETENSTNYFLLLLSFITIMRFGNVFRRRRSFTLPRSIINMLPTSFKSQLKGNTLVLTPTIRKDVNNLFGKYKGTKNSIQQIKGKGIGKLIRQARKTQKEILVNSIDQVGIAVIAKDNGYTKVTARSKKDKRVRDKHRSNDGTTWNIEEKQPWLDFNCRCTYFFKKEYAI